VTLMRRTTIASLAVAAALPLLSVASQAAPAFSAPRAPADDAASDDPDVVAMADLWGVSTERGIIALGRHRRVRSIVRYVAREVFVIFCRGKVRRLAGVLFRLSSYEGHARAAAGRNPTGHQRVFDLSVKSVTASENEGYEQQEKVGSLLRDHGVYDFYAYFDSAASVVQIGVWEGAKMSAEEVRQLLNDSLDTSLVGVNVVSLDDPPVHEASSEGGLHAADPGFCTTGFTVVNSSGTRRATSAGHCYADITEYFDVGQGGIWQALNFVTKYNNTWGDISLWTTPTAPYTATFRTDSGQRDVDSVKQASTMTQGDGICFTGYISGSKCGMVYQVNADCGGDSDNTHMILSQQHFVHRGDSGGPAYFGTEAWGSVKGWCATQTASWDSFSKAVNYDEAVGYHVLIHP
jgi:hypothetical protein